MLDDRASWMLCEATGKRASRHLWNGDRHDNGVSWVYEEGVWKNRMKQRQSPRQKLPIFNMDFLYDSCNFGISSYCAALNLLFSDLKMIISTDFLLPKLHLDKRLKFPPAKGSGSFWAVGYCRLNSGASAAIAGTIDAVASTQNALYSPADRVDLAKLWLDCQTFLVSAGLQPKITQELWIQKS